jgi:hypothetical protein
MRLQSKKLIAVLCALAMIISSTGRCGSKTEICKELYGSL